MKWSLKLGRILGIDVYLHLTFLILLLFVGLANWMTDRSVAAGIQGVVFFLGLFACVLLHEFGHALAARQYGIKTQDITLLPIGGLARLERIPEKPSQELWVAIAGPLVNVMIALGLLAGLAFTGNWQPLSALSTTQGNLVERLFLVNVMLVVFNLLPAFPMDGGRVLRALLAMRMDYARATSIAATIGQGMAFLFGFIGLFTNPMLLFIAFFVWIGASQEAAAAERKASFSGALVGEAMLTDFKTLSPENTLGDASRLILSGSQHNFPVLDCERLAGMLVNTDLFAALRDGSDSPVSQAMRRDFQTVEASEPLEWALGKLSAESSLCIPVLQTGRLVGLLTAENVGEFFLIRRALAQSHRVPPRLREAVLRI